MKYLNAMGTLFSILGIALSLMSKSLFWLAFNTGTLFLNLYLYKQNSKELK